MEAMKARNFKVNCEKEIPGLQCILDTKQNKDLNKNLCFKHIHIQEARLLMKFFPLTCKQNVCFSIPERN